MRDDELSQVNYVYEIKDEIEAPVDKDTEVGEVKIFINNNLHFSEKIYTMENVRRNSIFEKIKDLIERW